MINENEDVIRQRLSLRKTREIRAKLRMVAFMIGMVAMTAIFVFGFDATIEMSIVNIFIIVLSFLGIALTITVVLTMFSRWIVSRALQEELGVATDEWQE